MSCLENDDRCAVWSQFMRMMGPIQRSGPLTKTEFKTAVDTVDVWFSENASTIDNAFPTAAKTALTDVEKIGVFAYVAVKRYAKEVI